MYYDAPKASDLLDTGNGGAVRKEAVLLIGPIESNPAYDGDKKAYENGYRAFVATISVTVLSKREPADLVAEWTRA